MVEPVKPRNQKTFQLGLWGHPVKHSRSPQIHAEFARQFGIDLDYQLIDAKADELPQLFNQWIKTAHGCNITVPHKSNIMPLLDRYTERAHQAKAVNTVFWQGDELWGDNTDGDGLVLDLKSKNIPLKDAAVLVIGAGGASQGIIPSLLNQGVANITISNRNIEKAKKLAELFNRCNALETSYSKSYDLIIHSTSMGHQGLCPELKAHWFHQNTIAYDLSYGSAAEPFLTAAKTHGAKQAYDGLGMLYGQAVLAFEIWFGQKPTTKPWSF
jgi:shikimate dehydrogenase